VYIKDYNILREKFKLKEKLKKIIENVQKVIIGKEKVIKLALAAMLAEGHILFEDIPGVGKTILARSLACSINCLFKRIQFTPDLLPSDVTGVSIYNQKNNLFEFREGPIFSQVVLADEINRATPRTQSCLLESMAEGQITVEGESKKVPCPFIVMATQNPIEYEGTFPLPEAQLDRFLIRLEPGYPSAEEEIEIIRKQSKVHPLENLQPAVTDKEFIDLQGQVKEIFVKESIQEYIVNIVQSTRGHINLQLGASPRGSLGIYKISRAWAAIQGRDYVIPDDIKIVTPYVLKHRLILKQESRLRGINKQEIISQILNTVAIPESIEK
jgi:MoxR-like ATPase